MKARTALRVGIVGGVERAAPKLHELAAEAGVTLEFHEGHMEGRGSAALAALVDRVDVLLIVTDVNSHTAVQLARKLARKVNLPVHLLRQCGPSRFREWLRALERTPVLAA